MSDISGSTMIIMLCTTIGLLALVLALLSGIFRCLMRIEQGLSRQEIHHDPHVAVPSSAETSQGGAFETFLSEDPERRKLPKGEQFAEYRRWRHENGLNWSNS